MSGSKPLNLDEIDKLLDELDSKRDQAALLLSCACGLRAGTLAKLTLASVLDREHALTGRLEIPRKAIKGKRQAHALTIPPRALNALAIWIAKHPAPHRAAPMFPSTTRPDRGVCPRQWQRIISSAARRAGLDARLTPHSARKFFAQAIYASTKLDIQLTTRALGNKSPISTLHYLDFGASAIEAASLEIFSNRAQLELLPKETAH